MFKRFLRCISTFLVLIMFANMVPVQALDELQLGNLEQIGSIEPISTTPTISIGNTETAAIIAEVPEGRTEYTKEFLLSNGLHMATVYAEPIHYIKNGKWEDIDNTLVAGTDGTYRNTAGPWEVSFPQSFGSSQSISVTKDGYTLSFGMPQRLTANSGVAVMSADSTAETFATAQAAAATAQLDNKAELLKIKAETDYPETVLDKLSSRLTYENVHSDTNVIYDLTSDQVKESIVLEKQDAALRGFRYTLNTGTMVPVLEEDGTILFYDETQSQVVMVMPAPYLLDAVYEITHDISVTLTGSDGVYTLTYLLPLQWLAAEERQWPVILDPVITANLERSNIQDVLVATDATVSPYGSFLEVGHVSTRGTSRSYVKYETLPEITSADVIVSAEMIMWQMWYRSVSVPAEVHRVTEDWKQESITWENQPSYDEMVTDYVMGNSAQAYQWDVTDIVQDWYNTGNNYGLLFKTTDAIENAGVEKFRQFYSANYGALGRPALRINYRNNNGLEGYWDYSSASAGRAGTGYVNNYSGNLVWTRSDLGFGGSRMPVSIDYAYNTNDAANNSFGIGYGWRTAYNQLVYSYSADINADGTVSSSENYYVWEDSDGTRHYFVRESSTVYNDEDGMELTLNISGSGSSKTYNISDKNGNKSYFDTQGRLYKLENNQATKSSIQITYLDAESKLIASITDGAGRVYQFNYGDDDLLNQVSYMGTQENAITYVTYEHNDGNLTQVIYKDNKAANYTYTNKHYLLSAADIDGYKLTYTYVVEVSDFAPPRIATVTESDGNAGGSLTFTYEQNQTKLQSGYTNANNEEVVESTLYYQFNNFGNTVAIQDDEGRAQYAEFAKNDPDETTEKGNQLKLSSKLQNTVINLLSDSSFEGGTPWTGGSIAQTGYLGGKALQVAGGSSQSAGITVEPGETYTFSGYVKTDSGNAKLGITDGTTTTYSTVTTVTDWTRLQVSYENKSQSQQTVYATFTASASAYLDCVQFEQMPTASRYNLVNNGDFASSAGWIATGMTDGDTVTEVTAPHSVLSTNAYRVAGEYDAAKSVKQTISVSGGEGDSFVFGGWAMGNSASLAKYESSGVVKDFSIKCTIYNGTEEVQEEKVQFNANVSQWQFVSGAIAATGDYTSITIEAVYENNANTVWFDGLQLFKEQFGVSYTYNEDGNVVSVIDLQKKKTEYEYDNNNLTSIIEDGNIKMTYIYYENSHNVKSATTEEGQVYNFVYDTYGNNTKVSITENGQTIASAATYKDGGHLLDYTTDALGNKTHYGYNADTGLLEWVQYPEDTAETRTEYTYDNMYRTAAVTADLYNGDVDTGMDLSAGYTYEDDRLTAIITPKTTYSFTYGDFGLRTEVKIGGKNLATYSYESGTNRLKKLDYGNGDRVEYTYDEQGRLIQESYEDGETVSYAYDNSGNLATVTDSETGVVTTYYYDLLNRQSGYREQGSNSDHIVEYTYDGENNLASMTEVINGVTKTYTYTYDEYNKLISETVDGITVEYTYDDFGRLESRVVKQGETVVQTSTPTYAPGTEANSTSGRISSYNGYTYTYDDNGNILTISDGTNTVSYEYDSANQLVRENNQAKGYTKVWTYDNAGNIQSRVEYAYTTAVELENITPTDTILYGYTDNDWGDLLTSYDGKTVSYDTIGNPLSDGEWTYTWQHGRQLASMSKGSTTWTYTYDANGMRTGRTCNNGYSYQYVYNGSQLTQVISSSGTLYITYDASGTPLTLKYGNEIYYYVTNLQGDVIGLKNSSGVQVTTYTYDAWGNMSASSSSAIIMYNPLTYRGYVYDRETGLYYLQSRYYDPQIGRFLNEDALVATGQRFVGNNMFVYCNNNPGIYIDISGYDAIVLFDKNKFGHIGALVQDEDGNWWHFYWGAGTSGSSGSLNSFGVIGFLPVIPNKQLTQYTGSALTLDAINNSGAYSGDYEDMHYLYGDFSNSFNEFSSLAGLYHLGFNNCSQVTLRILASSDTPYSDMLDVAAGKILPGTANNYISNNMPVNTPTNTVSHSLLTVAYLLEEIVDEMR